MKLNATIGIVFINCDYFGDNVQSLLGPSIPEVISWSQNLQCHTVQTASLQYKDIVDCTLFSEVSKD